MNIEQIAKETFPFLTEDLHNQYVRLHNISIGDQQKGFTIGFNTAKEHPELLGELFEEFMEWLVKNRYDSFQKIDSGSDRWYVGYSHPVTRKYYSTSELFDLWIEQRNKKQ